MLVDRRLWRQLKRAFKHTQNGAAHSAARSNRYARSARSADHQHTPCVRFFALPCVCLCVSQCSLWPSSVCKPFVQ